MFRIIPARAGFTRCWDAGTPRASDHPRSRGVYWARTCPSLRKTGSSPLARGLLSVTTIMLRDVGIIPARAGFTGGGRWWSCGVPDHPRSRGVYVVLLCTCGPRRGSSPLARGLRHRRHRTPAAPRIIPARAGFTLHVYVSARCRRDHPPLARGLRQSVTVSKRGDGIIPARAGFTVDGWALTLCLWDHPRSRGVYGAPGWGAAAKTGSSPLARGLRGNVEICHDRFRIIPARAGFTSVPAACPTATWDHPRSRGVYMCLQWSLTVL